jgi:hypothetical protein
MASINPAVEPLAFLLGTWRGEGKGLYPTIADFSFTEELTVWHAGGGWLAHIQKTNATDDGRPLHSEMGYWRPKEEGVVELVVTHSFGIVEMAVGHVEDTTLEMRATDFVAAPTAKDIDVAVRRFSVTGDELSYEVDMEFGGHPLQHHLRASLRRLS